MSGAQSQVPHSSPLLGAHSLTWVTGSGVYPGDSGIRVACSGVAATQLRACTHAQPGVLTAILPAACSILAAPQLIVHMHAQHRCVSRVSPSGRHSRGAMTSWLTGRRTRPTRTQSQRSSFKERHSKKTASCNFSSALDHHPVSLSTEGLLLVLLLDFCFISGERLSDLISFVWTGSPSFG